MAFEKESKKMIKKLSVIIYWSLLIILLCLFFSNDFGLIDIRKTSIIVAVGVDIEEDEVQVTAQLAVPQPSENGENVQYTQVQGSGKTIADALNEINSKTGYYPKLLFCKLVLVGDECKKENLFKVLSCLYRRNYSELTPLVAMCAGKASDMLSMTSSVDPETSEAITQVLSTELEKSANVSSINLKDLAEQNFSVSGACYLPYVEANAPGTSEKGGNGDAVGGDKAQSGQDNSGGGESGQSEGGSGGQSASGGSSGGGGSAKGGEVEFTARKTAFFQDGEFKGIIDEQQSFALDLIKNQIRLAVLPFNYDNTHYTLGLKGVSCKVKMKVKESVPALTVNFKAKAQVQGILTIISPEKVSNDDVVKKEILQTAGEEIKSRINALFETCKSTGCDLFGAKNLLHKYNHKYFNAFKDDLLSRLNIEYKIDIQSNN